MTNDMKGFMIDMIVIGLDISTKSTGYSVWKDSTLVTSGCIAAASSNVYKRIKKITEGIQKIVQQYKPDVVYAEEPEPAFVKNNIGVYRKLTFAHGAIEMMLDQHDLKMTLCSSSHWRKQCGIKTGRGIKREELKKLDVAAAATILRREPVNDDEADAVLIGQSYVLEHNVFNWE